MTLRVGAFDDGVRGEQQGNMRRLAGRRSLRRYQPRMVRAEALENGRIEQGAVDRPAIRNATAYNPSDGVAENRDGADVRHAGN